MTPLERLGCIFVGPSCFLILSSRRTTNLEILYPHYGAHSLSDYFGYNSLRFYIVNCTLVYHSALFRKCTDLQCYCVPTVLLQSHFMVL